MDDEQKEPQPGPEIIQPLNQAPEGTDNKPIDKKPEASGSRWQRFRGWYGGHKKLSIPLTLLLLLLILAAVPLTRYKTAGLVVKKSFTLEIMDATTHTPVSGATVAAGSQSSLTDGNGKAVLRLGSGNHMLLVTKKYYKDQQISVLVPILSQKSTPDVNLTATGRQVKIVVKNLINQKPLSNVDIKLAGTTAKTDSGGQAIVVVPADSPTQTAKLSLNGYNDSSVTVKVSNSTIAENDFPLTPTGKIYFMSKRTGRLDMMKSNLDGSDAQVVVPGTGHEHDYDTILSASPDWKYVALLARRDASDSSPRLYILSTADDKLLSTDGNAGDFTLEGWAGDTLIYYLTRSDLPSWHTGNDKLKSYDANSGKITLLDQTNATGDDNDSVYEFYELVTISGNNVFYAKSWTEQYSDQPSGILTGKNNTASLISASGQGHKLISSYAAVDSIQYSQHTPNAVYIWQQTSDSDKFFDYTIGLSGPKSVKLTSDEFYNSNQTYYVSPSGQQTLWAESRDGKNTLFVGDTGGNNPSGISSLSDFTPYGWFTDDYILITKNGSELHIMGDKGGKAVKITDFEPSGY